MLIVRDRREQPTQLNSRSELTATVERRADGSGVVLGDNEHRATMEANATLHKRHIGLEAGTSAAVRVSARALAVGLARMVGMMCCEGFQQPPAIAMRAGSTG